MSDSDEPHTSNLPNYEPRHMANLAAALGEAQNPKQIGPYRILERIGEGGMGTVYKAQQDEPIQRIVAVKIIKLGMDTRAVLARFESERKALGMMDHPNVARVLDAGTTDAGRPYFVMEFVDGIPITEYADKNKLSVRDRLKLFTQACGALQHAHQKAIIHRDIKPSNILVTTKDGEPLVKVIDFGVAKATERSKTQQSMFTEVGQIIGTPEYMSPEQADGGRDVDTRSDVYSLGVVLFEMLSGSLPFDSRTLRAAGYSEVCRIIREVDPPRPSAKLSSLGAESTTVALRRQLSPATLAQQLRSELDWIVVKALRKDRESRYSSPTEMVQDIENYLENRPLKAGPESIAYRAKKFVRRNRAGVLGAACAIALLVGGIAATSWQAVRATRAEHATRIEQQNTLAEKQKAVEARKAAEEANRAAEQVSTFLTDMLETVDPKMAQGREVLVRDVLDQASLQVGSKFPDQPKVEAAIRAALGNTYSGLGIYDKADLHLQAAHDLNKKMFGSDSIESLKSFQRIAMLRNLQDRIPEAYDMTLKSLEWSRRLLGPEDQMTINMTVELGIMSEHMGKIAEAEALLRSALTMDERAGRADTRDYYITMGNLGQMLRQLGRAEEAEPYVRKAYENVARISGPNDPIALGMQGVYADVLRYQNKLPEAERVMRDYLDRALTVFGPDHVSSIQPEQGLAVMLETQGRHEEAMPHWQSALDRSRKVLGNTHRETLFNMMTFGVALSNAGDYAKASRLFKEAYDGWSKTIGPEHPDAVVALYAMIHNQYPQELWAESLEPARSLFNLLQDPARVEITPSRRARFLSAYGIVLAHLGRFDEAVPALKFAYEALIKEDIKNKGNLEAYQSVVNLLRGTAEHSGRPEEAAYWNKEINRFGPAPEKFGTLVWPTTRATTTTTTAPTSSPTTAPAMQ